MVRALVNSSTVGDTSNSNVAAIIDATDVSAPATDTLTDFKSINLITGITAGNNTIVPGAFMSNNFDISYGLGKLTILPAPLTVRTDSAMIAYGTQLPPFTSKITGYQYQDNADSVFENGTINYSLSNSENGQVPSANVPAGKFNIVPSGSIIEPSNYTVQYINGLLTVNKAVLTAQAVDTFRTYGDNNPSFRISYSGFLNGDGPSNVTAPTASSSASVNSNVGVYPISLSGGSADNYTLVYKNGNLTITPAQLVVKADNKTISLFSSLPMFTSTITGFKNGDERTIISGPKYKISPNFCSWFPAVFSITPYALNISNPSNYSISYQPGTLCVVWWYCPPNTNDKSRTSAYSSPIVARSADPTTNSMLVTNQLTQGQPTVAYQNGNNGTMEILSNNLLSKDNMFDDTYATSIFPNPTYGMVTININNASVSNKGIIITDLLGKIYSSKCVKNIYADSVVLDMSDFKTGIYFIKIMVDGTYKTFRVIKL